MLDFGNWRRRRLLSPRTARLAGEQLRDRIAPAAALDAGRATIATIVWDGHPARVYAGEWVVQFDDIHGPGASQVDQIQTRLDKLPLPLHVEQYLGRDGLVLIDAPSETPFETVRDTLHPLGNVADVEPNLVYSATMIPNDPSFGTQYGLNNTGQYVYGQYGIADADIDAPEAWDTTTGSSSVVVGVIDSGIDLAHPELAGNLFVNPGEIAGNGIDDDNNGYVDDVHGWDFVNHDNLPQDDNGHGTAVSGTIAAVGNNNEGIIGVAPNVRILPLKFLDSSGNGGLANALAAFNYAAAMRSAGVRIVATNNSWGGSTANGMLENAIVLQRTRGILMIAGAGNDNANSDTAPFYPASYPEDNVISVAASDNRDARASFSDWGINSVDIAAPGVSVLTTSPVSMGSYTFATGTSVATPFVSGAAALLASVKPTAGYAEIRSAILAGGDPIADFATTGSTPISTGKRLNLVGAIRHIVLPTTTALVGENLPTTGGFLVTFRATVSLAAPAAGPAYAGQVAFDVDGAVAATIAVDASGMAAYTTSSLSYPATHAVYAKFVGTTYLLTSTSNTVSALINDVIHLSPAAGALPAATQTAAYSQTITASDGTGAKTYTVSSGSLPSGLSLAPSTGVISGTPDAAGTASFQITATDTVGASAVAAYSIAVNAPPPPALAGVTFNGNIPSLLAIPDQHSRIASVLVASDRPVQLDANAFAVALHSNGVNFNGQALPDGYGILPTSLALSSADNITWTIAFVGNTDPATPPSDGLNSLTDGVYDFTIDASRVHPLGAPNVNAAANSTTVFFRLYGDLDAPTPVTDNTGVTNTATVNTTDNIPMRTSFNNPASYAAPLDFNGDATVNTTDNLQFRNRFNEPLSWRV